MFLYEERISHFVQPWEKLTKDQEILEIVQNSLVKNTSPGKNISESTPKRKSEISIGERDYRNVGERNKASLSAHRSACSK